LILTFRRFKQDAEYTLRPVSLFAFRVCGSGLFFLFFFRRQEKRENLLLFTKIYDKVILYISACYYARLEIIS